MSIRQSIAKFISPWLPIYLLRQVENELRIALRHMWHFRRVRRQLAALKDCRVNIGCGPEPTPGWINLDVLPFPNVMYWDCRRGLPFLDNAVAAIYSEHSFEHLDLETEAKPYLQECLRVLRPGGVLRLVVPDAGAYLQIYGKSWDSFAKMRPLERDQKGWRDHWSTHTFSTQMEFINFVFRQDYEHKFVYDEETLLLLLKRTGFSKALRQRYGVSGDPNMTHDREDRSGESLYVEAVK